VVAAVVLDPASIRRMPGLADSKLLTAAAREEAYVQVLRRAVDWHVVVIGADQIDATGLHVCNVSGMRRAFAGLRAMPGYVLTDGFPVRGLGVPGLAVWKGDRVTASVAAASILAKVSRDRMMRDLHERYPLYGFDRHKGYVTDEHVRALAEHGPSPVHRYSFVNVTRATGLVNPVDPSAPVDAAEFMDSAELMHGAELMDGAELMGPAELMGRADALAADPAEALVTSGISPAGASGENERRMDS
jgi:ribonuclease HII